MEKVQKTVTKYNARAADGSIIEVFATKTSVLARTDTDDPYVRLPLSWTSACGRSLEHLGDGVLEDIETGERFQIIWG
jgi:hypothetical protein